jgi:hypothetical protein
MSALDRPVHVPKRPKKVTVVVPERLDASIVTLPPHGWQENAPHGEVQIADPQPTTGCIFPVAVPTSVDALPSLLVAKYAVAGDATSTDSATFKGGTTSSRFRLVPIFYDSTAWFTSPPSSLDVTQAIRELLQSPYLSQLNQYGFSRLELLPSILINQAAPATHTSDDPANILASLMNAGAVPRPRPSDSVVYTIFYPAGTSVTDISACGWHYTSAGAWIASVEFADPPASTTNPAARAKSALDNVMRTFSHELVETITDPDATPNTGWQMNRKINRGAEISDACNQTGDFTAGVFVDAYWSERDKACIIPQPRRFVRVSSTLEVLDETLVSTGTVTIEGDPFDIRTCLNGTYSYTNTFVAQRARFFADSSNFNSPTFSWKINDAKGGPLVLPDGFNGTVLLWVDTWSDGPGTSTHAVAEVPVRVAVAGDELQVVADNIGVDYVNFPVVVVATATEGVYTAASGDLEVLVCQKFDYDDNYKIDLANCRTRLNKLTLQAIQLIPVIDKGDPPIRTWVDGVTRYIGAERVAAAAEAASVAAAIETAHPDLAVELRGLASVVYQIPAALLAKTTVVAG